MREFRREEAFDAVISMFTSFGYFENPADDAKVLINVYDSLRPGGALLIDVQGKENLARVFQERDWRPIRMEGREILLLEERHPLPLWEGIRSRWIFIDDGKRAEFTVFMRIYAATELVQLLRKCGFVTVDVYGDLSGRPYDHTASRLIAVARK
ncbi:MAG: hypothetical protein KatS3mg115_2152 [Candidatus Poribacteria bacterium]|nr:MAG: hypothetical protein KatS3mg115_2152 [Candidatus Poribacteria bacterium]